PIEECPALELEEALRALRDAVPETSSDPRGQDDRSHRLGPLSPAWRHERRALTLEVARPRAKGRTSVTPRSRASRRSRASGTGVGRSRAPADGLACSASATPECRPRRTQPTLRIVTEHR